MVFCPNCGMENADSARFCKKCGNPLMGNSPIKEDYVSTGRDPTEKPIIPSSNSSNSKKSDDNKNLIIICLTVVICAILIAGALVLMSNSHDDSNDNLDSSASLANSINQTDNNINGSNDEPASKMEILSGSFSTGSGKSDKTYCSVYVGEQYAGENVKISVLYSRDGTALNKGNIVPKTVDSSGYVSVPSADAFKYYPDDAYVTLYDSNGNVLDTQEVYLSPQSGKQTF